MEKVGLITSLILGAAGAKMIKKTGEELLEHPTVTKAVDALKNRSTAPAAKTQTEPAPTPIIINYSGGSEERDLTNCPQCGAPLTRDSRRAVCEYCGGEFWNDDREVRVHIETEADRVARQKRIEEAERQTRLKIEEEEKREKTKKAWKMVLWVLGWIYIFPIPLTILMIRNKKLDIKIRYGIIAGGWLLYLLFVFVPRSGRSETRTAPAVSATAETQQPAESPSPTPSPTAEPTPAPRIGRDGFDAETNAAVNFGNVWFFVPDYFEYVAERSDETQYCYSASNGAVTEAVLYLHCDDSSITGEHLREEPDVWAQAYMDMFTDFTLQNTEQMEVAGLPALKVSGSNQTDAGDVIENSGTIIAYEAAGKMILVQLIQRPDAEFDYRDDYDKIVAYIYLADEPVDEEPSQEPARSDYDGVTPAVKEFYDSYEAFIDEYVAFMRDFDADDFTMLSHSLEMINKFEEFEEKSEQYETELTGADLAYAEAVSIRVEVKLLEALQYE